jgi:hypothetical protein
MTSKVNDQLALNVRGMVRALRIPEVTEEDLPELISRLGRVSK